jgi:hypothetical protein
MIYLRSSVQFEHVTSNFVWLAPSPIFIVYLKLLLTLLPNPVTGEGMDIILGRVLGLELVPVTLMVDKFEPEE